MADGCADTDPMDAALDTVDVAEGVEAGVNCDVKGATVDAGGVAVPCM